MYLHIFFWHDVRANGEDKANPVLLSSKYQIWKDVKKYGIFFKKISQKEHTIQCRSKGIDSLLFLYSVFWTSTEPLIGQIVLGIFRQMDVFQGRSFHLWKHKGGNCFFTLFLKYREKAFCFHHHSSWSRLMI